jgi:hypothetical protein
MTEQEGILTPEQVERIKARERKRKQRANEKSAAASAQAETPESFWKRNREVSNQTRIAELKEREAYVFALLSDIRTVMEGRSPDEQFAADVEEEIKADVAEHGICQMEVYLLEFWKRPDTFAMLCQRGDATSIFTRYGLVTAILGHRLAEWEKWLQSRNPKPSPLLNFYTSLQCKCGAWPVSVSQSIADGYRELGIPFQCAACHRREKESRALASPNVRREALPYGNFIE